MQSNFDWSNPTVVRLIERYTQLNRKATPQDAESSRVVREVAEYYAANYQGSFDFMLSMRSAFDRYGRLTVAQASGTINCLMAEYRNQQSDARKAEQVSKGFRGASNSGNISAKTAHTFAMPTETLPDLPNEIAHNRYASGLETHRANCEWCNTDADCIYNADGDSVCANSKSCRDNQRNAELTRDNEAVRNNTDQALSKATNRTERTSTAVCSLCNVESQCVYNDALEPACKDQAACNARRAQPVTPACKDGTYTIVLDEAGDYRTLRLNTVDSERYPNMPAGAQWVAYLSGSDNEVDFTPMGYIVGTELRIKKQFKADAKIVKALKVLLTADREKQIDLGHAYALQSGNCFICGRKLTVPASIHRGMGPTCAERY